jgi:hypothetical protein
LKIGPDPVTPAISGMKWFDSHHINGSAYETAFIINPITTIITAALKALITGQVNND